jgi:hypothetical protein
MSPEKPQTMKPATAAKKLGVYLPATPEEFQTQEVTRQDLDELLASPPEWLAELRRSGPHPRDIMARKLGVSISGLARSGVTEALTTAEITALLQSPPEWLVRERQVQADVRAENRRVKDVKLGKAAAADAPPARHR